MPAGCRSASRAGRAGSARRGGSLTGGLAAEQPVVQEQPGVRLALRGGGVAGGLPVLVQPPGRGQRLVDGAPAGGGRVSVPPAVGPLPGDRDAALSVPAVGSKPASAPARHFPRWRLGAGQLAHARTRSGLASQARRDRVAAARGSRARRPARPAKPAAVRAGPLRTRPRTRRPRCCADARRHLGPVRHLACILICLFPEGSRVISR